MKSKIFYSAIFGILLGVLFRSFVPFDAHLTLVCGLIAAGLLLYFIFISFSRKAIVAAVFLLAFALGALRLSLYAKDPPAFLEARVGEAITLSGIVIDEPDMREGTQKLHLRVSDGKDKAGVLVTVDLSGAYKYGDEIALSGKLAKPENFLTDQGREFDYVNYLRKDGIFYLMYYPEIEILSRGNGSGLRRALFAVKDEFTNNIDSSMKSPESLLLGGLILGERGAFSEELRQQFIDTGTIHIVALSGYNVSIVAEWIIRMFQFLPFGLSIWAGILGITLFVLMTGAPATAVRAGVMAVLALLARVTGRTYDVARGLALAAVAMVLVNPYVLRFDVSFQLSFIATVAVIFLAPRFEKYFMWMPKHFHLREIIATTCAAYIFVLPFILYQMGNLSLVAIPANVLVLPLIPPVMLLGFATGFLGFLFFPLSVPFAHLSYAILHFQLGAIDFLANIPFAGSTVPAFPFVFVIAVYGYFVYVLFRRDIREFFTFPPRI